MPKLDQLVREAVDRLRETTSGCFISNAAAVELSEHGAEAIPAIENEVLVLAAKNRLPHDLASVMVIYSQLLSKFDLGDRAAPFLQQLPPSFREEVLGCACSGWRLSHSGPGVLPSSLHLYLEMVLGSGTAAEQREAKRVLMWYDKHPD